MKNFTEGIDSKTGEYFYHEHKKPRKRQPEFVLDFENYVSQLEGSCSTFWIDRIGMMIRCKNKLRELGVLPDNYQRRLEKQITLKALSAVAKFKKEEPQ